MPRQNRRNAVDQREVGFYHCVQRVVRRAFLCGTDPLTNLSYGHRKVWVQDRLVELAGLFGVEIAGFSVMSNHLHLILRNRPDVVAGWTDQDVARRWLTLFPGRLALALAGSASPVAAALPSDQNLAAGESPGVTTNGQAGCISLQPTVAAIDQAIAALCALPDVLKELRARLSSLSWFMRALAEPIARRANREDRCTGRFWEGRFKSQRLLDEAAVLACSIYVDLNPIRAGLSDRPETSPYTSAHERIRGLAMQPQPVAGSLSGDTAGPSDPSIASATPPAAAAGGSSEPFASGGYMAMAAVAEPPAQRPASPPRCDDWLAPIELIESAELLTLGAGMRPTPKGTATEPAPARPAGRASDRGILPMTLEKYLSILDWTGRQLRSG